MENSLRITPAAACPGERSQSGFIERIGSPPRKRPPRPQHDEQDATDADTEEDHLLDDRA